MKKSVAILGAGIGEKHLIAYRQLSDRFAVTHICDLNTELASELASSVGAQASNSIEEIIENKAIDIIDICLPPPLHVPVALGALEKDKHVILEKPIAGSLHDADRLGEAEKKSNGRIFPIFQYRFGRAFSAIDRLREAQFLSRPLVASLETHWNRGEDYYNNPWRGTWDHEFGGVVLSHAIHIHDLLMLAFGPIEELSAMLTTRANPIETEDCAAISFRMTNGATATSSITLGAANDTSRMRLLYDDVTIESNGPPYGLGEADWMFLARDADRQSEIDTIISNVGAVPEGFNGFLKAVSDALRGRSSTAVTLCDGIKSIELATAIYHSERSGRRVSLPFDRTEPICSGLSP